MSRGSGALCVLLRVALAAWALSIAADVAETYHNSVEQTRFENVTAMPCDYGLCALVRDSRQQVFYWQLVPPRPSKDTVGSLTPQDRTRIVLHAMVES